MPEPFPYPGETWSDVCSYNGRWLMASAAGTRVNLRTKSSILWSASIGVQPIGVRCAVDHVGRVVIVGKLHNTGHVFVAYNGDRITDSKLNQNVHGNTGVIATYDYNRHEWLLWRMHDGFTLAKLRIDPNPIRIGDWEYEDVSHLHPEGNADGFSYTLPGPDGYAIPQYTRLTRAQTPGLLNASPAAGIWVGQHPNDPPRLMGYQPGIGYQTLLRDRKCEEPHVVEYEPGKLAACSWDPPQHTATVVEFESPLTPDPKVEYPVMTPARPHYSGLWHHVIDHDMHPDWGHETFPSTLDVVTDQVEPVRPSIVNPTILQHISPRFVEGLLVHEPETVEKAKALAEAAVAIWENLYPTLPRPPVCCCLSQKHRAGQNYKGIPKSLIGCWIPELNLPEVFPDDPEGFILQDLAFWWEALGTDRHWVMSLQVYDRNGRHSHVMDEVRRVLTFAHNEVIGYAHVVGFLGFDANRSGLYRYPDVAAAYEAITRVCKAPEHIAPFTPVEPPVVLPNVELIVGNTTVEVDEKVNFEVRLLEGSGPVREIEWYEDTIGDGQPARFFDRTAGLTNKFWWGRPGTFAIEIKAKNEGGAQVVRSPHITVTKKDEEDMPFRPVPRDEIYNVLNWLRQEVYPGVVGHPLDDEGIAAWVCDRYVALRQSIGHEDAKHRVYAEIEQVVRG